MEDLLESFDPLHSSNRREPLFPAGGATSGSRSQSNGNGSGNAAAAVGVTSQPSRGVAVSLKDAPLPLDLLSLQDDDDAIHGSGLISSNNGSSPAAMRVNDIARQRQEDVLAELQSAEQVTALPLSSASSSRNHHHQASQMRPPPPRRLSRSGLMAFDASASSSSSTTDDLPIITHALASPSSLVTNSQPSDLFHPSSPPEGSSLDSLRHTTNSYFSSLGRSVGSKLPHLGQQQGTTRRRASQSNGSSSSSNSGNAQQNIWPVASTSRIDPPSSTRPSKPQLRDSLDDQSKDRSSFPNIDNSDLFARSTSYSKASRPRPSTTASSFSSSSSSLFSPAHAQDPSSSAGANLAKKSGKKAYTFDFPATSSLLAGPSGRSSTIPAPPPIASTSRGPSPLPSPAPHSAISSLTIDSEPLPALTLKVPAAATASSSNRILTDDIAEGVSFLPRFFFPPLSVADFAIGEINRSDLRSLVDLDCVDNGQCCIP